MKSAHDAEYETAQGEYECNDAHYCKKAPLQEREFECRRGKHARPASNQQNIKAQEDSHKHAVFFPDSSPAL
jgi:hypothetical protein